MEYFKLCFAHHHWHYFFFKKNMLVLFQWANKHLWNIFVSRQSQYARWRRKRKTERCPWNQISWSPRRNLSRNQQRKRLRSKYFFWLVASCCICPIWIYGRNIVVPFTSWVMT
jgi:hypothetical protein